MWSRQNMEKKGTYEKGLAFYHEAMWHSPLVCELYQHTGLFDIITIYIWFDIFDRSSEKAKVPHVAFKQIHLIEEMLTGSGNVVLYCNLANWFHFLLSLIWGKVLKIHFCMIVGVWISSPSYTEIPLEYFNSWLRREVKAWKTCSCSYGHKWKFIDLLTVNKCVDTSKADC